MNLTDNLRRSIGSKKYAITMVSVKAIVLMANFWCQLKLQTDEAQAYFSFSASAFSMCPCAR